MFQNYFVSFVRLFRARFTLALRSVYILQTEACGLYGWVGAIRRWQKAIVAGSEDQDGNKEICGDYASELASLPRYAGLLKQSTLVTSRRRLCVVPEKVACVLPFVKTDTAGVFAI